MQQSCTYGSVRGAMGDHRPYRDESLAAFDGRCIPAGCVAPRSNTPGIATPPRKPRAAGAPVLGRRALPAGRLARLGATPDFHHGLLGLVLCGIAVVACDRKTPPPPVIEPPAAGQTINGTERLG